MGRACAEFPVENPDLENITLVNIDDDGSNITMDFSWPGDGLAVFVITQGANPVGYYEVENPTAQIVFPTNDPKSYMISYRREYNSEASEWAHQEYDGLLDACPFALQFDVACDSQYLPLI